MDGKGGKENSVESVIRISATDAFLQHGSKSQVNDMNLGKIIGENN